MYIFEVLRDSKVTIGVTFKRKKSFYLSKFRHGLQKCFDIEKKNSSQSELKMQLKRKERTENRGKFDILFTDCQYFQYLQTLNQFYLFCVQ